MQICCSANSGAAYLTNVTKPGSVVHDSGGFVNLSRHSVAEGWNSEFMRSIRQQFLAGGRPAACTKCWRDEELGHRSKRQWENEYWQQRLDVQAVAQTTKEDGSAPQRVRYLDIKLGTKCNLKCVTCSPHESSAWVADWRKLETSTDLSEHLTWQPSSYSWFKSPQVWAEVAGMLPDLQQIYVIGGEPTIIDDYYKLLELCVSTGHASHIELRHNTNGTELNDRLINLWRQFKKVTLHVSIDATGERNDYLRFPSRWEQTVEHLRCFDAIGAPVTVNLDVTVSLLNVFYLPELIEWKLAADFKNINRYPEAGGLVGMHFLYLPRFLNVRALPAMAKKEVGEKLTDFIERLPEKQRLHPNGAQKLCALLRYMNSHDDSHLLPQALEYLSALDAIRGTSWHHWVPGSFFGTPETRSYL